MNDDALRSTLICPVCGASHIEVIPPDV